MRIYARRMVGARRRSAQTLYADSEDVQLLTYAGHVAGSPIPSSPTSYEPYDSLKPNRNRSYQSRNSKASLSDMLQNATDSVLKRAGSLSLPNLTRNNSDARTIFVNNPSKNQEQKFLHNRVFTGKYTVFTFLPKFLYEEFSKYANLFFLFISGIQQIPGISPTSRWTTLVPLVIVLIITAVKELVEDWGVHRSDAKANATETTVLEGDTFRKKQWKDIVVGDIIRMESGEFFPADLILLSSSEPEGLCYIETSNLDGEVNLKIKQALPQTSKKTSPLQISNLEATITSEKPNNRLYTYDGTMSVVDDIGKVKDIPLTPDQLLLRGAQLRNTGWIYGVVVFTGHETKLLLNSSKKPSKSSNITRITNRNILFLFAILVLMSIAGAVGDLVTTLRAGNERGYLALEQTNLASQFGYDILTFLILFNSFIPISLMVTMELVKYVLSYLIDADLDMYYDKTETPATARSSSLIEELGQVKFVFSDKTGTLTCNQMEFRQCSIAGLSYADKVESDRKARDDNDPSGLYTFKQMRQHLDSHHSSSIIHEFLTLLATCHTVIPEMKGEDKQEIVYQASSPDEGALVAGAKSLGYTFHTRKPNGVIINIHGVDYVYEVLNVCEFNSTRKRMSTIVRTPDGKIKLYCKGADTVILERLANDNPYTEDTLVHLEDFATEGLRTLCIAMREISEEEYAQWSQVYERAATTLKNRADELDKAAELIERDLFLLGATAIEDKLQEGVPETIYTLQEAGIKVWVLTGDRQETAINIGYSCKLLQEEMSLIVCNEESLEATKAFLENKYHEVKAILDRREALEPLALVIDGKALTFALEKEIEKVFLDLAVLCKAVICCRVSPLQKALVVKVVKKYIPAILLAIGDGANDVSMIQAAHVGIGISGVEGLQAAQSADFAISQFRFLKKLLLVHGSWAYQRLSKMIFYYFYKNVGLYLTLFWFAFFNGFSGQTLYESWTLASFNVIFTFLPPFVIGVFDQHASARTLDKYPQMYMLGQSNFYFGQVRFWGWMTNAVFHSAALFFIGVWAFADDGTFRQGWLGGHWWVGTTIFTATLFAILMKGALVCDIWTKYTLIAFSVSVAIWFIFVPLATLIGPYLNIFQEYYGIVPQMFGNLNYWLYVILVPLLCNIRDLSWKYYKRMYRAETYHVIQEIQKYNIPDYRPRMDRFKLAVNKVRKIQRLKQNRGYAFSQSEGGQDKLIRAYDTTSTKPAG
ncbi:hypothetical protein BZG36_00602 [Bifiguratus adelaidae]|uniref:Phospholipid-transporting ATPase n=1 Tax=Bifiguratus adelaidae TaxID=1938954 RepID=A0A261Y7M5_9FUNG|nr:hypothetical protein BZG36_00602 [Bifiguratus adelaidae]